MHVSDVGTQTLFAAESFFLRGGLAEFFFPEMIWMGRFSFVYDRPNRHFNRVLVRTEFFLLPVRLAETFFLIACLAGIFYLDGFYVAKND